MCYWSNALSAEHDVCCFTTDECAKEICGAEVNSKINSTVVYEPGTRYCRLDRNASYYLMQTVQNGSCFGGIGCTLKSTNVKSSGFKEFGVGNGFLGIWLMVLCFLAIVRRS